MSNEEEQKLVVFTAEQWQQHREQADFLASVLNQVATAAGLDETTVDALIHRVEMLRAISEAQGDVIMNLLLRFQSDMSMVLAQRNTDSAPREGGTTLENLPSWAGKVNDPNV